MNTYSATAAGAPATAAPLVVAPVRVAAPTRSAAALTTLVVAAVLTGWIYWMVGKSPELGLLYPVFYQRGPFQYVTTTLFAVGVAIALVRWWWLFTELRSPGISLADDRYTSVPDARKLLAGRERDGEGIVARCQADLLAAFAQGRHPDTVLERVGNDADTEIASGGRALAPLMQTLPLVGLLGTVVGLSGGIGEFSSVSAASDLDGVRAGLQGFAASISTAFDTTLLALAFLIALWPFVLLVRTHEERLRGRTRSAVRDIVDSLDIRSSMSVESGPASLDSLERAVREVNRTLSERHQRLEDLMRTMFPSEFRIVRGVEGGPRSNGSL